MRTLEERSDLLSGFTKRRSVLFDKKPAGRGTAAKAEERGDLKLLSVQDLYAGLG